MAFPTVLPTPTITPLRGGPILRWGILAPGGIATSWVKAVHAHTDQKVVAVASRSLARAQAFATANGIERAYGDYEQLVADPGVDVVYIAAPHSEHLRLGLMAIAAGKHVLVEKPIALNSAEARQLIDAAHAAGVFAMEALWSRFLPQASVIAQLLERGVLGEVKSVSADFGARFTYNPEGRWFNPELGGGAMLDIGIYPVWFSHFVLGAPEKVTARGTLAPTGVDAQSAIILEYASNAQAVVTMSMWANSAQDASIVGTDARIEVPGHFFTPGALRLVDTSGETLSWSDDSGVDGSDGLAYQVSAVAAHIAEGRAEAPEHSHADTLAIMAVLEEARAQLGPA
jgi:predicted dehydrogenase